MKITKALKFTLIFAVVGIMVTLVITYVQRNTFKNYNRSVPYITLIDHVKNKSTQAYLRAEQILAGFSVLDFQKGVMIPLVSARQILQGAYDGKHTAIGDFNKSVNEDTRALLKESIIAIEKLTTILNEGNDQSKQNFSQPEAAGGLRQNIELAYNGFNTTLDRLKDDIVQKGDKERSLLNLYSWGTSLLVFASFTLLVIAIYKLQSGNDRNVNDRNLKLEAERARVETLSQFVEAVSSGNYNIEIAGNTGDDNLTNMLVNMRDKLKSSAEDDKKRNWTTSGLAQIGEILRVTSNASVLYDNIIKFIVKYTKSNQGGLFILHEEEGQNKYLELVACYAFERKKYLTRQVEIGDGLVGQCFLEGERIYLRAVPEEYVNITSGLGAAPPRTLLVVPMKVNDTIYGVIELASFNLFEEYEIELVEKLAENIAATISSVRVNETTRELLERTQQQAEEMKSQEEEIRQNMEELEATQEEMRRKQDILELELKQSQQQAYELQLKEKKLIESQDTLQAIVDNLPRAIFWKDKDLLFMGCNKIFAEVAGEKSPKELIGKSDFDMAWKDHAEAYRRDDMEVINTRKAKLDIEEANTNSEGETSWVLTSKVPVINENNEVIALLGMFEDITARKRREADVSRKLEERESALKELTALKQLLESRKV